MPLHNDTTTFFKQANATKRLMSDSRVLPLPDNRAFTNNNPTVVFLPSDEKIKNLLDQQDYAAAVSLFELSVAEINGSLSSNLRFNSQKLYDTIRQIRMSVVDDDDMLELSTSIKLVFEKLQHKLSPSINKSITQLLDLTQEIDLDRNPRAKRRLAFD